MDGMKFTFQYYPGRINSKRPIGFITLDQFVRLTQSPSPELIGIFQEIHRAEVEGDQARKAQLKQSHLHYFTPCVHVRESREYKEIQRFTGLAVLDFDHIDNAADFKEYLFFTYRCVIAAWLSPSRRGVKALVHIPEVKTTDEFKAYYFGLVDEMDQYNGFDPTGQNSVLPLFQSWDPDLLRRPDFITWTMKGTNPKAFQYKNIHTSTTGPVRGGHTDHERNRVIAIITKAINSITKDPGHLRLRSTALALGGFVGAGYISSEEAEQLIFHLIEGNRYLQKGIGGYKITAAWGIHHGQGQPLELKTLDR